MRYFLPFLLLLTSCSKETTFVEAYYPLPPFRVSGINDVDFVRNPFSSTAFLRQQTLNLKVIYGKGNPKKVTLEFENPNPAIDDTISISAGYPDFTTQLTLTDLGIAPNGNYKMRLTARADGEETLTIPINVTLAGDTSCTGFLSKQQYQASTPCLSNTSFNAKLELLSAGNDTMLLTNFRSDGLALRIVPNCASEGIIIPTQTIGSTTFSGSGSFLLQFGNLPATPYFQLTETTAGGATTTCNYFLETP